MADPNCSTGCPVPYGTVLSNGTMAVGQGAVSVWELAGHWSSADEHLHCALLVLYLILLLLLLFSILFLSH